MPAKTYKIPLRFNRGLSPVARLGTTVSLRPVSNGYLSYGQGVDIENDEFGRGQLLPGPALTGVNGGIYVTGVIFLNAVVTSSTATPFDFMFLGEGLLGATNMIRVMTGIAPGGIPEIQAIGKTVTHNDAAGVNTGHTGVVLQDMVYSVDTSRNPYLILIGVDATDVWIQRVMVQTGAAPNLGTLFQVNVPLSLNTAEHRLMIGDDNSIYFTRYVSFQSYIGKIATNLSTVTASAFTMPSGLGISALGKYQTFMAIAYCTTNPGTFVERKSGGKSGIIIWDYVHPIQYIRDVPCPANYISAVVNRPNGNTLVFGGLDEGKTTLYEFDGYGFRPLVSYVGDMPRNNHSVTFDGQGRILWQTVDGQLMRYNFTLNILEHLASQDITPGYGGICTELLSGVDQEFLLGGGKSGTTFPTSRVRFGTYRGDNDAANDTVATPLAVLAPKFLPPNSIVEAVELRLNRNLMSGDKLAVRLYTDGSTTPINFGTISFDVDGAIATKIIRNLQYNIDNVWLGIAWKMADEASTAPGIVEAYLIVREPITR
jgi:hypothetical protein